MKARVRWLAGILVLVGTACVQPTAPSDSQQPQDSEVDAPAESDSQDVPDEEFEDLPDDDALPGPDEGPSCGCANVSLSYEGEISSSAVRDIRVQVLPGGFTCDPFRNGTPPPTDAVLAEADLADLQATSTFDCLPPGATYTLHAEGHRQGSPCGIVSGCSEGVFLTPNACVDRTLALGLLSLNLPGRYDCIDHLDFTDMVQPCAGGDTTLVSCDTATADLGQAVCCALSGTIRFFTDPGLALIDTLQSLADAWVGTLLTNATIGLFKDAVARIVTAWMQESSPPYVQEFVRMGRDFVAAISYVEMRSELTLSKAAGNTLNGSQYWRGLTLYWPNGCSPTSPAAATCGVIPLDLEALDDPLFPREMLGGTFGSLVSGFDQLTLVEHPVNLDYGRLVLYVLNEVVIAGFTGGKAHDVKQVAHLWLDCAALSVGILGEVASTFGGTQADIEALCNQAVDAVVGPAANAIDRLAQFPVTSISIEGQARLVDIPDADQSCDLVVDAITRGASAGSVQGTSPQAAIKGDFECQRR